MFQNGVTAFSCSNIDSPKKQLLHFLCSLILIFFLFLNLSYAFQGFQTPVASVLPHGRILCGVEGGYYESKNLFDISLDGDLIVGPVIFLKGGFGNRLDAEITWDVYRYVMDDSQFGSTGDFSDPSFFVKLNLLHETYWPQLSVQLGAKEPMASDSTHVGTDEADIFGSLLVGKTVARTNIDVRMGIGIYGDRNMLSAQQDAFLYGLLISKKIGNRLNLGLEYAGRFRKYGSQLNQMGIQGGFEWLFMKSWYLHGIASAGLVNQSESWGVKMGFSFQDKVFE